MTKKQNPSNRSTISTKRRELQDSGEQILRDIAEQNTTTPSAGTSTLSPGYIESHQAPNTKDVPLPTKLQQQRFTNKELDRIHSDNSSDHKRMIKAVCESADLSSIDTTLIQMLSCPDLDINTKTMLLSLLDLLASNPSEYLAMRTERHKETIGDGVARLLNLMEAIKIQCQQVATDDKLSLLEERVMEVIKATWPEELRSISRPSSAPDIILATIPITKHTTKLNDNSLVFNNKTASISR